jgi:GPI ethanolamine phosphate transferase 1
MSVFTLLPAAMTEEEVTLMLVTLSLSVQDAGSNLDSVIGGALMVVVGLLYLILEDFVLADFTWPTTRSAKNNTSRTLVGVQTGLTLLAIIVTRSSALSLQTKQGLPLGNQILGWIVLGEF